MRTAIKMNYAQPTRSKPATQAQLDLIRTMITERSQQLATLGLTATEAQLLALSTVGASRFITRLKQIKRDPRPVDASASASASAATAKWRVHPDVTVGFYIYEGLVVKVKHSQYDGRLYTSILQEAAPGEPAAFRSKGSLWVLAKLTPAHRMTREQAAAYGSLYGRCACCGRLLTDDLSIERGIGPVCWDKHGYAA